MLQRRHGRWSARASFHTLTVCRPRATRFSAAWSPDGRSLVISRAVTQIYNELLLLNLETKEVKQLTESSELATYADVRWACDGKGLYLSTNKDREFEALAYMDVASGEFALIAAPDWDVEGIR